MSWIVGPTADQRKDEHRCTVILRTGLRCGMWRSSRGKDKTRCWKHQHHGGTKFISKPSDRLPRMYSHVINGTLQDRVDQLLSMPRSEQVELYAELALQRDAASRAVALYDKAVSSPDVKSETVMMAASIMADQFKEVKVLAEAISKIEAQSKDTLTIHTLNGVVEQITRLFYEVCGDTYSELAGVFADRMRTEIILPTQEAKGSTIRPGEDIRAMDATVPPPPATEEDEDE